MTSQLLVPPNVTVFGGGALKDVIKVKRVQMGGL